MGGVDLNGMACKQVAVVLYYTYYITRPAHDDTVRESIYDVVRDRHFAKSSSFQTNRTILTFVCLY